MAKYWYSYTIANPASPARNQSSNYVYVKTGPTCSGTAGPCRILADGNAGTTTGSHPPNTTLSANLQSYLTSAIGSHTSYPVVGQPFVFLHA